MTFWSTDTWHEYERLCGDAIGTRSRLLESATWQTRVVDLSASEAELWQGVRRSYHALIHKAERERVIAVVDAVLWMEACRGLHLLLAGRNTRPLSTWQLMLGWAKISRGMLVAAADPEALGVVDISAYAYFTIHGAWAYYFSAASFEKNLNHALLWHAMKALKARGVRWFEIGWLEREGDTQKQLGIVQFKRGWPGVDLPAADAPLLCARG